MAKTSDIPNITVLMSAYNGGLYIEEQIESIRNQKDVNVRLLIRDDGSKDNTISIVNKYKKSHPDFDIRLMTGNNIGYVDSFFYLVDRALSIYMDCDYFAFSDHDDVWLEDKLFVAYNTISNEGFRESEPVLYCANALMVDSNLNEIGAFRDYIPEITKESCLIQNIVTGCTTLFNRKAAQLFTDYKIPGIVVHDQFLYIICTLLGHTVYDPTPHILYRQHGSNQVGKPNFYKRFNSSLKKLTKDTHSLENRACNILTYLNDLLDDDNRIIVGKLANYRKSLKNRILLLFDSKFRYQSLFSNIVFKFKIIIGRV